MPKGLELKGKTYEDIYGKDIANQKRKIRSVTHKKKWENNIQKRKYYSKLTKERIKAGKFGRKKGSKVGPRKQSTIKKIKEKNTKWKSKKQIINLIEQIIINNQNIPLTKIPNNNQRFNLPARKTLYKFFSSIDELAQEISVDFIRKDLTFNRSKTSRIGKNEKLILDNIERQYNIKLERQYYVDKCFIDGYDKENNIVYEVDEKYHNLISIQIKDKLREKRIKSKLGCNIIRLDEQLMLNKIKNIQLLKNATK